MPGAKDGFGAGVARQFSTPVGLLSNGIPGYGRDRSVVCFSRAADDLEPLRGRRIQASGCCQSARDLRDSVVFAGDGVWRQPTSSSSPRIVDYRICWFCAARLLAVAQTSHVLFGAIDHRASFSGGGCKIRHALGETGIRSVHVCDKLVWGTSLIIETVLRAILAWTIPIDQFLIISPIVGYGIYFALFAWTLWFVRSLKAAGRKMEMNS